MREARHEQAEPEKESDVKKVKKVEAKITRAVRHRIAAAKAAKKAVGRNPLPRATAAITKERARARAVGEVGPRSPQAVADLMARPGGASMGELVAATGVQPHPLRAKIYDARHKLGYAVRYDAKAKRYLAAREERA